MTTGKSVFHFKHFSVCQDRCAMRVGTDGVLLGALAMLNVQCSMNNVLDIGTGTGLIALMVAQRNPHARIVGIDIDPDAAAQAADNFAASPWGDRLTAVCADINGVKLDLDLDSGIIPVNVQFDNILCNPPFYANSPAAATSARDTARRTDTLSHEQLAECASRLLADDGLFEVILPYDVASDFIHLCWLHDLHLVRRIDIRTKPAKPFTRVVLSFAKAAHQTALRTQGCYTDSQFSILTADSSPSDEYRALTADFYLDK